MKTMNDGFVRIAAVSPQTQTAAPHHNKDACLTSILRAVDKGANIVVLPECTLTSYISNDLLYQDELLQQAEDALSTLIAKLASSDVLVSIGVPLRVNSKLYNTVCLFHRGKLLSVIPKTHIPTYGVDYEGRWFEPGPTDVTPINIAGFKDVPFGTNQLLRNVLMPELTIAAEICEDIWCPEPPSIRHALAGATVILNSSASNSGAGKKEYRRGLIGGQSGRLICCYVYCSSGNGDSTSDVLVGSHNIIAQNGTILSESLPYEDGFALADVNVESLCTGRRGMSSFIVAPTPDIAGYKVVDFKLKVPKKPLLNKPPLLPFVPDRLSTLQERCQFVFMTQIEGICAKLTYLNTTQAFIIATPDTNGILALLATASAFRRKGMNQKDISVHLKNPASPNKAALSALTTLCDALGCTLETSQESPIKTALTCEDNMTLVVYPYDMTQFSIGTIPYPQGITQCYAVNSTIAHSLVPEIIRYLAQTLEENEIKDALAPFNSNTVVHEIACESLTCPPLTRESQIEVAKSRSELPHECPANIIDFYLNAFLDEKFSVEKTFRLVEEAYSGIYSHDQLLAWLRLFYERFFATEYLRASMPDGPRIASVTVSPRDDYMMPGGKCGSLWIEAAWDLA